MIGWIEKFPRWSLSVLAVLCLLPGTWMLPLMDRDEPRFARATVEMNERGSWAVPYFNGQYRFDKPPLTYWCMEPGLLLFGKTEMGVRLHSLVASWVIALVLYELVVLMGGSRGQGFVAGAGWLTCLQVILHGRLAVADVLLIVWVALAMLCLVKIGRCVERRWLVLDRWFLGLVGSLALGFLAKGPLVFLVPGFAIGLGWLAMWSGQQGGRRPLAMCAVNLTGAVIPALAVVALWGIPALIATDGSYFDVGIGKHVIERGTVSFNERKSIPGVFYLIVMIPFLLPWTAVMPRALRGGWRSGGWEKALMLGWFVAPFLIFSFYATQLPHYILPGYPGLMVLIGLLTSADKSQPRKWWQRLWHGAVVGLPLLLGVVAFVGGLWLMRANNSSLPGVLTGLGAFFLLLAMASWQISRRRTMNGIGLAAAGCLAMWPTFQAARDVHLTLRLRDAVGQPTAGVLRAYRFNEPSLVWYFQRPWEFNQENGEEAALTVVQTKRWRLDGKSLRALVNGEAVLPTDDDTVEALGKLPVGAGPPEFVQGWNPGTNSWLELAYVRKKN